MKIAEVWPTLRDSLIPCIGICMTWSTSPNVESSTPSTSLPNMTATPDEVFFLNVSKGRESLVISAAMTCIHCFLANSIASGVWPNCCNPTVFSAPSEVFTTFCVSSGDGVYQVNRTCHQSASAVRIIFPTL